MFNWFKNSIFHSDFDEDRVKYLLEKVDLKNAQWLGVYRMLVETCSRDDRDLLLKYFKCDSHFDNLIEDGLVTKIIEYRQKSTKEK